MRPLLPALVALAALVAGCVAGTSGPLAPAAATTASGSAPLVGNTGVFHSDHATVLTLLAEPMARMVGGEFTFPGSSTEPSIGADKAGGVYMTGYAATPGATGQGVPTAWATFDHGQTMKDVGPKLPEGDSPHTRSFDPILYVDQDTGRVFLDDIWPLGCGALSFSDDKGASWTNNPLSCGNPNVNDHQTVATAKPRTLPTVGYPKVVYRCVNNLELSECAMSYDGGLTFSPQVPAFVGARDGCSGTTGHVKGGPDGKAYLPIATCPGGPILKVTSDDGLQWDTIQLKTMHKATNHDLGLAIDAKNDLYVTWESGGQVWYSASADGGKTWLPERNVTAPGVTAVMFNAIAVGAPGRVAIAYLGSTIPGGYDGKCKGNAGLGGDIMGQPTCPEWDNATWNAYFTVMTDALNPNATMQSVTANDPSDPLARGLCGGTRCHGMNDFIEITVDNEGRPWASFVDVCTQKCVTDPTVHSDVARGAMMTLRAGPSLLTDGALTEIAPQAKS